MQSLHDNQKRLFIYIYTYKFWIWIPKGKALPSDHGFGS